MKELKLEEEDEAEEFAAHLLDQLTTSLGGATYKWFISTRYICNRVLITYR